MFEPLFRGKRRDNNARIVGDLFHKDDDVLIHDFKQGFSAKVIPETVGLFTGKTDINGIRLFCGDIVRGKLRMFDDKEYYGVIVWRHEISAFGINMLPESLAFHTSTLNCLVGIDFEIVGNVFDTPELLEGGVNENDKAGKG
ncbi:MAG: YopX family protein [Oscillospiraceae bacterium]|nr:YopX family protein [Oscillospiraceae bacterium]